MDTRAAVLCVFLALVAAAGVAQGQPVRGIVWEPPARQALAEADLRAMAAMGVQAIRTPLLRNERLYRLADSLGLALYQDLPFSHLAAGELADTMQYAGQVVQEALWWAESHPSARHFGLTLFVDTSDAAACDWLESVRDRFRAGGIAGLRFYYLPAFIEDDRCADVVDFVLLDTRDAPDPLAALRRWQAAQPGTPVGIGALGTWVRAQPDDGTRVPNAPSYQARYLETHLTVLLSDTLSRPPERVFVHRWRDRRFDRPSPAHDLASPYVDAYGLQLRTGERRPAASVVAGVYTGTQTVFAFPPGRRPGDAPPWLIVMGWGVMLVLGYTFFRYSRFQSMVRRYFFAHGFYRESVAQGRELLLGPNALLLGALFVAAGLVYGVILEAVRGQPAFEMAVRSLPESAALSAIAVLGRPITITLVMGCVFAIGVMIWTSTLSALTTRNRKPLLPGQVLMLVAWPRWTMLPAMVGAMVLSTLGSQSATPWALVVGLGVLATAVLASIRTLYDYRAITRARAPQMLLATLSNPLLLALLASLYLLARHLPEATFIWHLITRS